LTIAATESQVPPRFGLLDDSPGRWPELVERLKHMNLEGTSQGKSYKLIFAARHGQGYHNIAERAYESDEWENVWSRKTGDDKMTWGPDAELTPDGITQAQNVHVMWFEESRNGGLEFPKSFYISPLTRTMRTFQITFEGLVLQSKTRQLIVESCRERYGIHLCDKRRSKSYIKEKFPLFEIEEGFTEEDELFDPDIREDDEHLDGRARAVLEKIFTEDQEQVVSITAHCNFIEGLLRVANHKPNELQPGGVIPLVVECAVIV